MLKDNVLLKEIPRALVFRVQFCLPEVSSAGEFENFSMFRWLLLLLFFDAFIHFVSGSRRVNIRLGVLW